MRLREAGQKDLDILAAMNQFLIRDEGHQNSMTIPQLRERMAGWLAGEYRAFIFSVDGDDAGYVLYRNEAEWVYVRQFYIKAEQRRQGLGLKAMEWLRRNPWQQYSRIRLEVLVSNEAGMAFWRAAGFMEYCITMEANND